MQLSAKAQSAVEYIFIIGLTLAIVVPTTYLFFNFSSNTNVDIVDSQIQQIGRLMVDNAETVYFSGKDSKIVIEANMPESVTDVHIIDNRELVFNVTLPFGESENVFFSLVNISSNSCSGSVCSLSGISGVGLKKIRMTSIQNGRQVLIEEV